MTYCLRYHFFVRLGVLPHVQGSPFLIQLPQDPSLIGPVQPALRFLQALQACVHFFLEAWASVDIVTFEMVFFEAFVIYTGQFPKEEAKRWSITMSRLVKVGQRTRPLLKGWL